MCAVTTVIFGTIAAWMAAVILGREFLVSSLRMVAAADGRVIAANYWPCPNNWRR